MRIVGGRFGGRHLNVPVSKHTRPTAERVREAIASALEARAAVEGARVVELYAGTGALGFELLSRGAERVLFVEKDARMAAQLLSSARELGVAGQVDVIRADITRERPQAELLSRGPFDLLIADPPYADAERALSCITQLESRGLLAEGALLLLETSSKRAPVLDARFQLLSSYRYGDTAVTLFEHGGEER